MIKIKTQTGLGPILALCLLCIFPQQGYSRGAGALSGQTLSAKKHYKSGLSFLKQNQHYLAACSILDSLAIKNKPKRLKKLIPIIRSAYDEKLKLCQAYSERKNHKEALENYHHLKLFLDALDRFQLVNFVTVDIDKKISAASLGVAADAYKRAETSFQKGAYPKAIEQYRVVIQHAGNYEDAREKIAECFYRRGKKQLAEKHYRKAAEHFVQADKETAAYKDAAAIAKEIYYQMGNHAFNAKFYRRAWNEYQAVVQLDADYKDVRAKQAAAMETGEILLGFGHFENKTGFIVSGIAIGDFIFQELRSKLEGKGSRFFKLTEDLENADYVANGAVTQVLANTDEPPEKERIETVKWVDYDTYKDANGKKHTRKIPRSETIQYYEYSKSREVIFSGYMNVSNRTTQKVLVNKQISKSEIQKAHWAELITQSENAYRLSQRVRSLLRGARTIRTEDQMIKSVIAAITDELAVLILAKLDKEEKGPDPDALNLEVM